MIYRWDVDGPYEVVFTSRQGGVSEGPFESLNLGKAVGDDPACVDENRRRVCAEVGADPERLALNRQRHSASVHRAEPGARGEPGDGLWTDVPGIPMLALSADCLTVAIARINPSPVPGTCLAPSGEIQRNPASPEPNPGSPVPGTCLAPSGEIPALAVLHAGWRGLLEGIVEAGCDALGGGSLAAAVGPAIGPCCYEVGPEVAEPFERKFGPGLMDGRKLDLWTAAERALRAAGCTEVHRVDLCTHCNPDLFFSERRTGRPRGTHGVLGLVTG